MSIHVEHWTEPSPAEITQRFRQRMGDKKVSRNKLAMATGINRTSLGEKLDDRGVFTVPELFAVARALGRDWLWAMTGVESPPPPSDGSLLLPQQELNVQTHGCRGKSFWPARELVNVA
jgi:transcriptional regulator with XRE-family HTH domain